MKKKSIFKQLQAGLLGLILLLTLSACSKPSIDGSWTSPSTAQMMYEEGLKASVGDAFVYSDHTIEEIITETEVNMTVKDDKAVLDLVLLVDKEMFFTALKEEQKAGVEAQLTSLGLKYDDLSDEEKADIDKLSFSDDQIRELVKVAFEEMAKQVGGAYDADKGRVSATFFKADVNRSNQTLKMTEVNSNLGDENIVEGESYQYSYKDGKLVLEGEADEDDMVFEKKN